MSRRITLLIAIALWPFAIASGQEPDVRKPQMYRLDLTAPDVVRTHPFETHRTTTHYVGKPTLDLPLEMRLVSVRQANADAGPVILYEVTIRNIGDTVFDLPWSVDRTAIEGGTRPFLEGVLTLEVGVEGDRPITFGQEIIVGHRAVKASTRRLMPGDSATIRVPGSLVIAPEVEETLAATGTVPVRATLRFNDGDRVTWQPLQSINTQTVSFRPR
jgi:hypothetical protein